MVQDLVHNLCESLVVNIGGVAGIGKKTPPTPVVYLTQWKIVGNSEVHTLPYLTSWKVSGNSVVDNNTILSCGDLGQDGKYHVKISNGINVYDIALDEPLRKVNDVADTIEFPSGVDGKALITRNTGAILVKDLQWHEVQIATNLYRMLSSLVSNIKRPPNNGTAGNIICPKYNNISVDQLVSQGENLSFSVSSNGYLSVLELPYSNSGDCSNYIRDNNLLEFIYELNTPTTELVDAPQISVSPTDTYTSANTTPYSAFEHTENKEIWSCGEYNPIDGKWHILVQPEGGSIADIALTEPLRKVNDVADSIEFADGVATVTRAFNKVNWTNLLVNKGTTSEGVVYFYFALSEMFFKTDNILSDTYPTYPSSTSTKDMGEYGISSGGPASYKIIRIVNTSISSYTTNEFRAANAHVEIIYELATPTTEIIQVPQIQEAESYTCVISQGGKAISWSSFETN